MQKFTIGYVCGSTYMNLYGKNCVLLKSVNTFFDILCSINKKYYYLSVKMAKNVTCKQCSKQAGEVNNICCDAL